MMDEQIWRDMFERMCALPATALVKVAKDEGIELGYVGGSRRSMARAIVSARRKRALDRYEHLERMHPWRKYPLFFSQMGKDQ